ncbi:MAG: DUF2235 domain-containing protein [Bacteroidia bacterium]
MGKNIIVFSDGTGQKGGVRNNTNVYKLFNMIEDRTPDQVAFYDPGLGTNWQKISGNLFGHGFSKNILDCYNFIFENFESNDDIFLFGFSRGAATVRSLSGFIHLFGILPQSRPDLIKEAFKIYKISDKDRREKKASEFIGRNHTMWCKIKFIGVFDTVAALGLQNKTLAFLLEPFFPHKFHSFELSDSVLYARQAISIDEERKTFLPIIWDALPDDPKEERLKQVWFCGVHTDVGGGYAEEDLSNFSLKWMIKEATAKGLIIYKDAPAYIKFLNENSNINGIMHNEQKGFIGILFRRQRRSWDEKTHGTPRIHESVLKRSHNQENSDAPKYSSWILQFTNRNIEAD